MVQTAQGLASSEAIARIEELKGRRDRIQEQLRKANSELLKAKDLRDTHLLALYAVDHQIELLEEGQLPLFGEVDDE